MIDQEFIQSLGLMIVAAALFALGVRLVKLPGLVAFLLAGLVLGPLTGLIILTDTLALVSDLGIVLLLFLVGLELSFDKLRNLGWVALLAGLGQVTVTASMGFGFSWLLGWTPIESGFLAMALTFSSTVVAVKLLEEKKEFNTLYARVAVGILLFQDLVVIILLTFLAGFTNWETLGVSAVLTGLGRSFGGMALMLAVVMVASKYLLPRPFAWAARAPDTLFIWSLCWCFFVVFGAHVFHLSHEIGAFLAGLGLAQLPYNHDLRRRVNPLMNFFIAVFFVSLGIKMDLSSIFQLWPKVLAFSALVLVGKFVIVTAVVGGLGLSARTAVLAGLTLSQISEFSFILMALGLSLNLVQPSEMSLVGLVGLVTISVSSCFIVFNQPISRWLVGLGLNRVFPGRAEPAEAPAHERKGHVIVVGMNTLGRELVRRLAAAGEQVVAVDTDPAKLADLPGEPLLGNVEYWPVLEEAGLPHAKLVVSALQIEDTNDLLAYRAKSHQVPCSIHATDMMGLDGLLELDVTYLMLSKADGIKLQNAELRRMGFLTR